MKHSIEVLKVDQTDELDGLLTFRCGQNVYNAFYWGYMFRPGERREVSFMQLDYPLKWEAIFGENRKNEIKIEKDKINDAGYYCYGIIESLQPIIANFGDLRLNIGNWTNDEKVIGEFIYWKIDRLDISFPE